MLFAEPRVRLALAGALAALVAGGLIAYLINGRHRGERTASPPASQAGLVIDPSGTASLGQIDAAKPLRCFVDGKLAGELSLKDCAERNGVATDALDVGVDPAGALTGGRPGALKVTPLSPTPSVAATQPAIAAAQPTNACWRYADKSWRKLPSDTTLGGCTQALFGGRCEAPGGASYGRWGQQTLRLVPGKVEISADNHTFRTLAEQGTACSIASIGG
jgi:hypothetical protein